MRRTLLTLLLLVVCPTLSEARARFFSWCEVGNRNVTITGAGTSTTDWMQSFPSCTVTVYNAGTATLSTIFSDNSGTALANPFTADANGYFRLYADTARYDIVLSGGGLPSSVTLGDVYIIDASTLTPSSVVWSGITAPTGNLALAMSTFTSVFTYGNLATTASGLTIVDGAGSTTTGALLNIRTTAGSVANPVQFTAQSTTGGVKLDSAGLFQAIGTGGIRATDISCTECISDADIDATGISTRSKLPAAVAYTDTANTFSAAQTFTTTISIRGGTANNTVLTSAPAGNVTVTIPAATDTLVNLSGTQTLSGKTVSDNLVFMSGTAFLGTFDHGNTVDRVYTLPNATVTLLGAPALTAGSIMFTDGTTLDQDNSELFWNTTTKRMSIGNGAPAASLHVQPRATASEVALRVQGDATANTDVLQVYNSAGSPAKISFFGSNGGLNTAVAMISTLATGTAPFTIASTTVVTNLNVDSVDGADWAAPGTIGSGTPNTGAFTTLTASTSVTSPIHQNSGDVADAGAVRLANADIIGWEAAPAGTDVTLTVSSAEVLTSSAGFNAPLYATATNCSDSAGDAACGAAPSGAVVVDAADSATVVSTTAVTANSNIFLQNNAGLGTRLSVTCNTQADSVFNARVTAFTAATSFTITVDAGPTTNPLCLQYWIVN